MWLTVLCFIFLNLPPADAKEEKGYQFEETISEAQTAFSKKNYKLAQHWIQRALERDPKSCKAWSLQAQWAEAERQEDERVYALHQWYRLAVEQNAPQEDLSAILYQLTSADNLAEKFLAFKKSFIENLLPLARFYEEEGRPHSAIRTYNEILALAPEREDCNDAISRIAAAPDPSLADSARARDLLADVSEEWIKRYNKKHSDWKDRVRLEKPNYTTITNAGYEVLIRTAEATENVNAFFRNFFKFGTKEHDGSVPRLELRIFKCEEDYRKQGSSSDNWSGGVFTGDAIETFIGRDGFNQVLQTLFHEITHQFVRVATHASSTIWLNEGLATYFEGTQVLPNGSVQMNMPADHRLFPLVRRMEQGWMKDRDEVLKPGEQGEIPKAPPMEMVITCNYKWGPPWYDPVWGITYFFFNYQDPVDGRYLYRETYRNYIQEFGGRSGSGAIKKIEEMVLGKPSKPTKGLIFPEDSRQLKLPKKIKDINETWKEFLVGLRNERSGRLKIDKPFHQWARYAVLREDWDTALEHFEKGLMDTPDDPELLIDFAKYLASHYENTDRASKLALDALRAIEQRESPNENMIREAEDLLAKWDPKRKEQIEVREALTKAAHEWAKRYMDEDHSLMAMDLSWRLGLRLGIKDMMSRFEEGYRKTGKSLWNWKLAYNEKDINGWISTREEEVFIPKGAELHSSVDTYDEAAFNYALLTMDNITSGDFSLEAEFSATPGKVKFCGLVIGNKGTQNCQAIIFFPGRNKDGKKQPAYVDLAAFYDDNTFETHRHYPVEEKYSGLQKLRVDVSGKVVDVWYNGKLTMSHEYSTLSVPQGQFGIVSGVGEAMFRNIRYLERERGDPAARIERKVRMEKLESEALAQGGSIDGSWLNKVPAWPEKVKWVQGERSSWEEKGPVPTLVVFWSIEQNRKVPIDGWLNHLAAQYADTGIEFISIVSAGNERGIEKYLQTTSFPGAVCVDTFLQRGYGHNFERFGIGKRFELPRLVLLDIDQKTAWEGDPGFKINEIWQEGITSYLDVPLKELVERKRLSEFNPWFKAWTDHGEAALRKGDLDQSAELLVQSQTFPPDLHPKIKEAHRLLYKLQVELDSLDSVGEKLAHQAGEPAMETFLHWCDLLQKSPEADIKKSLRPLLVSKNVKEWSETLSQVKKVRRKLTQGSEIDETRKLLEKLEKFNSLFPEILKRELTQAADSDDRDKARQIMDQAEALPARWLAEEYFKW
ncbi:MAG: family 16 glycoside hydrolase [Planctomycetota bacterium]